MAKGAKTDEMLEEVQEEETVIDENQFPKIRLVQFGSFEQQLPAELPNHNRNVSAVAKSGGYSVKHMTVTTDRRNEQTYYTYTLVLERE